MIDPADVRKDMYPGRELQQHDQRVVRQGWTYYVRGTKSPRVLVRDSPSELWSLGDAPGILLGIVLVVILKPIKSISRRRRNRREPWTVAVVRMGYVGSWNDQTVEVVHHEQVARSPSPESRIAELVADVRNGRFHPAD